MSSERAQSTEVEYRCARPSCSARSLGVKAKRSSFFRVFRPASDESPTLTQGFFFGGRWFCSRDCLKWALGEEIGQLFHSSSDPATFSRARLGTILRARGSISAEQVAVALAKQQAEGGKLGGWLVKLGYISEDELISCLAEQLKIPWIKELDFQADGQASGVIPAPICRRFNLLPLEHTEQRRLLLAVDCSFDNETIHMIGDVLGCSVKLFLARRPDMQHLVFQRYGSTEQESIEIVPLGGDLSRSVGHSFLEQWFDVGANKARFGLFEDLLWIRFERNGGFSDHVVRLGCGDDLGSASLKPSSFPTYTQLSLFPME